jgi:hypothetical protein
LDAIDALVLQRDDFVEATLLGQDLLQQEVDHLVLRLQRHCRTEALFKAGIGLGLDVVDARGTQPNRAAVTGSVPC